jgi:uncharacterized protein YkwD
MKKPAVFMLIMLWPFYSLHSFPDQTQEIKPFHQRPDVSTIEKRLLKHVNNERMKRNLAALTPSTDLNSLALRHSQDMASQRKLAHLSITGQSYLERLVDAGFYFIKIGENVAVSETFRDDIIHQKLMASSEHRENILEPDFDRIGIGIVYKEKKYYITQDYLQSLNILGIDEAERKIQIEINRIRLKNSLPPLTFSEDANSIAQSFSTKRANGHPLPNLGNMFGETHIRFITFPSLHVAESISKELTNTTYGEAGVGVWFGRLKEYPGGTYVITLFLFPQSIYKNMNEKDLVKFALEAINTKRKEQRLHPLKLDKGLSEQASHISEQLKRQSRQSNIFPAFGTTGRQEILSYVTEDLYVWPSELEKKIVRKALKNIGLGISSGKNEKNQKTTFWVTLIFLTF